VGAAASAEKRPVKRACGIGMMVKLLISIKLRG
jgi:hypothetical protein